MLRAVAQRGSFTAAAAELGYTQSAISKRMAALETTAGHALVIRERRGVRLSRAGEVLLRHATTALEAMEDAERELDNEDTTPDAAGPAGGVCQRGRGARAARA